MPKRGGSASEPRGSEESSEPSERPKKAPREEGARFVKTTDVLIAANVAVYVVMLVAGGIEGLRGFPVRTRMLFGADYAPLVREGQIHRLFTSTLVHGSLVHLALNMVALRQIGALLEDRIGRGRLVVMYLVAGVAGSVASLAWSWRDQVVSAGASAGVIGLIGGAAAIAFAGGEEAKPLRNTLAIWFVVTVAFSLFVGADHAAHAGGLVAGGALGFALRRANAATRRLPGAEAIAFVALVAIGAVQSVRTRGDSFTADEWTQAAAAASRANEHDAAIAGFRRALQLDPEEPELLQLLGFELGEKGELVEAITVLERAHELEPGDTAVTSALAGFHLARAAERKRAGDQDAYDEHLDRAMKLRGLDLTP